MRVIFLDIDGVLQPYDSENRFYEINKNSQRLIKELSQKYNIDYFKYNIYDIFAVYYDWNNEAVARLKNILDETSSKIIISSDWRSKKQPYKMRDLLAIKSLNSYWVADNIILDNAKTLTEIRALEIKDSLQRYSIENYLILDDMRALNEFFPANTVITHDHISINDMKESIKILKR